MKRWALLLLCAVFFTGCAASEANGMKNSYGYTQITQDEAKEMMEKDDGHIIVDVRRADEYAEGHIPGAVNIPNETIGTSMPSQLPDPDQVILVYCRSGNRSKDASAKLAGIGYTNVYEFGGINTWTGEIVAEDSFADAIWPVPELVIRINGAVLYASLQDNPSAEAFIENLSKAPVTVELEEDTGFAKAGLLPWDLPRSDETVTAAPGDVILDKEGRIAVCYGQGTAELTCLAKLGDTAKEKLSVDGDITAEFSIEWSE